MAKQDEAEKILKEYLNKNHVLILDAISSGRTNIASCLAKFGATRSRMSLIGTMHEAREEIKRVKPKVIFADFMIGKESSLDLIQDQKAALEKEGVKDTLFVLVTSNASQSTVARAAEEDVDTFIIKPFSLDTLKKGLMRSVQQKLYPSEYHQTIEAGKGLLLAGDFKKAIEHFKRAMDLNETPTLACFYYGQAEYMQKALDAAEGKYQDGLDFNNIHYKCLTGLFDLLHNEKRYHDAYDVMRRLAQYFPANPKRLSTVLQLSIQTSHFEDVEDYYKIFVELEERTDELIRYMCSALAVTGRYYLKNHSNQKAISAFESAAISSAGRIKDSRRSGIPQHLSKTDQQLIDGRIQRFGLGTGQ